MTEKERELAIRVAMLPRDTNGMGTIFGGAILSHLDLAGGIEARRTSRKLFVTKAMDQVVFHAPVFVGDTVSFYTRTARVGRTSVTVCIDVEVERLLSGDKVAVTSATVTYVAVDENRQPIPVLDE
jgi:acyl-CoA thioesterase YciA